MQNMEAKRFASAIWGSVMVAMTRYEWVANFIRFLFITFISFELLTCYYRRFK